MADNSGVKALIVSFLSDLLLAIAKSAAAFFIGSASMLAEAIHSFLDCGNSLLLLYARKLAVQETSDYPLGRDRELFFWSFIVALLLFTLGGVFNIHEGWDKLNSGARLQNHFYGIAVLFIGIFLELIAIKECYRAIRQKNPFGSLLNWIKYTANADLMVISLANVASLIGLLFALCALLAEWVTQNARWDGIGSLAIGILLVATALLLTAKLKPLLIGKTTALNYRDPIEKMLAEIAPSARITQFIAIQRGLNTVLIAYKIHPGVLGSAVDAINMTNRLEDRIKQRFKEVTWQFAELDTREKPD